MLLSGDEVGRTQHGNNNVYCQDNEVAWFDWETCDADLFEYTKALIALRTEHPVFRRRRWFQGRPLRGTPDVAWLKSDGTEMSEDDWSVGHATSIGLFLNGEAISSPDPRGQRVVDDSFLLLFNTSPEPIEWRIADKWGEAWGLALDTAAGIPTKQSTEVVRRHIVLTDRSVVLLRRVDDDG
jgi:glycogen operon protein